MKKVRRGTNMSIDIGLNGGDGFTPIWKYNESQSQVRAIKAKVASLDQVPDGYLLEKRCLSIRTKSGSWVLLPCKGESYGFLCGDHIKEDKIIALGGEIKKDCSYHVEEKVLYIEDRLTLDYNISKDWSFLLDDNFLHCPVLFYGRKDGKQVVLSAWWKNGSPEKYKEAIKNLNQTTKISSLARTLIEEF